MFNNCLGQRLKDILRQVFNSYCLLRWPMVREPNTDGENEGKARTSNNKALSTGCFCCPASHANKISLADNARMDYASFVSVGSVTLVSRCQPSFSSLSV